MAWTSAGQIPAERLQKSLTFLTTPTGSGLVPKGALDGLRLEASDIDWAHGSGPTVHGSAEVLLLAMTGRTIALKHLHGDGIGALGGRVA